MHRAGDGAPTAGGVDRGSGARAAMRRRLDHYSQVGCAVRSLRALFCLRSLFNSLLKGCAGRTTLARCATRLPTTALTAAILGAAGVALADPARIEAGRRLAFATDRGNCLGCHEIAGGSQMGTVGPPLADMRRRFPDRALLRARLWDARDFNPDTLMPPFGRNLILTAREMELIIDFLYTL